MFLSCKTELYDRDLTDLRDKYDPTSAYIVGEDKKWSNAYAINCYVFIRRIASDLRINQKIIKADKFGSRYNLSAKGCIDIYNNLLKNDEMDFMEKYIKLKKVV